MRLVQLVKWIVVGVGLMMCGHLYAAQNEPKLIVEWPGKSMTMRRSALLNMNTVRIAMRDSRAYPGIPMQYTSVKLCDILKNAHLKKSDTIEITSKDHFTCLIPAKAILECTSRTAIGYLAIETANHPWPPLTYNNPDSARPHDGTAGPFSIIWVNPKKSYISNEYWAWKVSKISVHHRLDNKIYLSQPNTENARVRNGYRTYVSRCAGCHTINHQGKAVIGSDLNIPKNPVEYFPDAATLKKFIRNPQSVRSKSNDRMSGTSVEFLSEKDLDDLIYYLRYVYRN